MARESKEISYGHRSRSRGDGRQLTVVPVHLALLLAGVGVDPGLRTEGGAGRADKLVSKRTRGTRSLEERRRTIETAGAESSDIDIGSA
jgi:hypothetical protein